jgi:hypothetical protein
MNTGSSSMKDRFLCRPVLLISLACIVISLLWAVLVPPFFLHFTDGISICSVILLLLGVLNIWWKEGAFSFFLWKKENGPYAEFLSSIREERKNADNHTLYAGLWMFGISLLVTGIYMLVH